MLLNRRNLLILSLISLICVGLRMYKIGSPIADWHSWRQADTSAVARNYLKNGINLLVPRYDDLSNIQTGKDNPMGYRMVEFPLYQGIGVIGYRLVPGLTIEVILRILTVLFSLGTCICLVILVSRYLGIKAAYLTGLVYAILPYSVYYGRSILPDPLMVFLSVLAILFLDTGVRNSKPGMLWYILSVISAMLALLVKPTAAFLLISVLYIFYQSRVQIKNRIILMVLFGVLSVIPLLLWRRWILNYPEGIPAFDWLLNGGGIRFKGAWFYWLFAERIGNLILGYWGLIPLGAGFIFAPRKNQYFPVWFFIPVIAYFTVIARGNVQHDYYQILIIPALCIAVARGIEMMVSKTSSKLISAVLMLTVVGFTLSFSWYTIRTFYWINRPEIIEAGKTADALIPKNAKVIAPYNGDTTFLYQTNRSGWPIGFDIDNKIKMGATHYVTVSPTDNDFETRELAQKYTVLVRNDKFAIIDLTKLK